MVSITGGDPLAYLDETADPDLKIIRNAIASKGYEMLVKRLAREIRNEVMTGLGGR